MIHAEQATKLGLVDSVVDLPNLSDDLAKQLGGTIAWSGGLIKKHSNELSIENPFAIFQKLSQKPNTSPDGPAIAILHIDGDWSRRQLVERVLARRTGVKLVQAENTIEGKYNSVLDDLGAKDILALVQELSPGYRTVFNMYVVEGYTHREIADMLGISEGTSKSQLSRAKVILQDMVKTFIDRQRGVNSK